MQLIPVGPIEPPLEQEDAYFGNQRLRTCRNGEVVWTVGSSKVRRRFARTRYKAKETQSLFAIFENELCACTLIGDMIQVNGESGAVWDVSLPFRGKRMWTNSLGGLIVERKTPKDFDIREPAVFSIHHPLDEPKPIEIGSHEEVVWVFDRSPFLLSYSTIAKTHTVWQTRRELKETDIDVMDIQSELVLVKVRTIPESEWPNRISKAFIAHNAENQELVCAIIAESQSLYCVSLNTHNNYSFNIPSTLDAAPVCNSTEDGSIDVVVLRTNGMLELYRGFVRLCELLKTQLVDQEFRATSSTGTATNASNNNIARFQRFTSNDEHLDIIFTDRYRMRVAVRARPLGVSEGCNLILRAGRESSPMFGLALTVDVALFALQVSDEFDSLVLVMDELMQHSSSNVRSQPKVLSAFDQLLSSDIHFEMENESFPYFSSSAKTESIAPAWQEPKRRFDELDHHHPALPPLLSQAVIKASANPMMTLVNFFRACHLTYQDLKLNVLYQKQSLCKIGSFLAGLCESLFGGKSMVCEVYRDMYSRDLGRIFSPVKFSDISTVVDSVTLAQAVEMPPPDITDTLFEILKHGGIPRNAVTSSSHDVAWKGRCAKLIKIFSTSLSQRNNGGGGDTAAVLAMVECGINPTSLETFPVGIQTVLREILYRCRENPSSTAEILLPREVYTLIGREDIYLSRTTTSGTHLDEPIAGRTSALATTKTSTEEKGGDLTELQYSTRLRFGRDHRIKETFKVLDSAIPPLLFVARKPEMTDHDHIKAQQVKLRKLVAKSVAGTLGRGALMLFMKRNIHEKTVKVPELAKSGRVPPQNVQVQLDEGHSLKYSWPLFHNGVAAGLSTIPRDGASSSTKDLTRSWILFNKAKPPTDSHAGVILALGLNRDLACLTMADTYEHIEPGHDLTSIAILLGLGCAKAGSCDPNVRKTLTLHVPSLFPQEFSDLDVVPSCVQSAALAGLGLLYRGTCNRLMCEFFLEEMAKPPASDAVVDDRSSYALSAGLGLGMVALGFGAIEGGLAGLADLEIEDRLHLLISGGPVSKFAHQIHALYDEDDPSGMEGSNRVAPVATRQNSLSSSDVDHRLGMAGISGVGGPGGLPSSSTSANQDPKCSRVQEGTFVNTDVTAPGATMALGLIYLKSNDISVAQRLAPPQTKFLLENIRPDLLLYRVWAKSLILWDSVQPSLEWIFASIPACLDVGRPISAQDRQDAKYVSQSRAFIVVGAALGLGVRYAGSMSRPARDCLLELFQLGKDPATNTANGFANLFIDVDPTCSDTCYSGLAIALGLIMAGSGDLETLRVLRSFRKRAKRYGAQQISSLAIGFLFLGCGKMSFSTSNESIASIICSIFPILADSPEDNSCYLQALRHLYVLAAEYRCVEAFDSDTGEQCFVPLVVTLKSSSDICEEELSCAPILDDLVVTRASALASSPSVEMSRFPHQIRIVAPGLLPPLDQIESISVRSPRYWPLSMIVKEGISLPLRLVVKLRADQLPYQLDPRGLSCLSARPRPRVSSELLGSLRDFASKSPFILSFAKHVPDRFEAVYECLVHDSLDMLPAILEITSFRKDLAIPLEAEQFRFLKQYYSLVKMMTTTNALDAPKRLVSDRLLLFDSKVDPTLLKQYLEGKLDLTKVRDNNIFFVSLNLAGIPKLGKARGLNLVSADGFAGAMQYLESDAAVEICDAWLA